MHVLPSNGGTSVVLVRSWFAFVGAFFQMDCPLAAKTNCKSLFLVNWKAGVIEALHLTSSCARDQVMWQV